MSEEVDKFYFGAGPTRVLGVELGAPMYWNGTAWMPLEDAVEYLPGSWEWTRPDDWAPIDGQYIVSFPVEEWVDGVPPL